MIDIDLLIGAEFLYPMTDDMPVIVGGEVAVRAGRIVHAGPAMPAGHWRAATTIEGRGRAVLPGFVNCHSHAASTVFRSQSDDGVGGRALYTVAFRAERDITPDDWRDLAVLGCADMIKAGITTINDIWYEPEALAEAAGACGLRAVIANKIFDVRMENLWQRDYTRHPDVGAARLRDGVAFVERWHGKHDGRITGRIGAHAADTCGPELHREAFAEARRLGVGLHTHVAQSPQEVEHIRERHGRGPAEYLRDLGVLGSHSVLAHLTFAGAGDLDAVRDAGARYAHCPIIYPRRGVYPDVAGIRSRGIVMGFATDWMMNDPFEGMRNAMQALRLRTGNHEALTSRDALWFSTAGAARALGLDGEVGTLEPGKKADLIQVAVERAHMQPFYGDYASIAFYAKASDVTTSVIDGHVVMRDGRVVGLDEASAITAVKRRTPRWAALLEPLGGVARLDACGCPSR